MKKQPPIEARSNPIFRNTPEKLRYFYHPDHIGSTSWVTDSAKNGIQYCEYLPYGEPFIDQRSTTWNSRYTFSGKERDGETGYSYFGARYYNSDISIWLSVDPLSDKYPNLSPYAYCGNNPIILVDPDGKEIVDADGNIIYTHDGGWTENATEDAKRIGNSMMETETGKEQFNKLVDTKTKIQLKISNETRETDEGGLEFGNTEVTKATLNSDGSVNFQEATITVFEGSIEGYLNGTTENNVFNDYSSDGVAAKKLSVNDYIGAVAGHEAAHTSQENMMLNHQKYYEAAELEPRRIKSNILWESWAKKLK